MAPPRYKQDELWVRIRAVFAAKTPFSSVVKRNRYSLAALDEPAKRYCVRFQSRRRAWIPLRDLFAVYSELYRLSVLPRDYLRDPTNGRRIVGHLRYSHAPGATIYAILPALDDKVQVGLRGDLFI